MEKFVCVFMCLVALCCTASALKCHECESDQLIGCAKDAKPKEKTCPDAPQNSMAVCTYKVFFETAKSAYKVRSNCGVIQADAPLNSKSQPDCNNPAGGTEVKECRVCNKDFCNASSVLGSSTVSFLSLPLMYFATKYLLY
ncbi:hypothetical protein PPYR_13856 [Photinus pyralis]|uniref:Protein sleepless n=1 Tax=Photinus pyralis TaxID=7054 RepID=A0A5N4AA80_PHOPY|nr:U-scoloptoxin(05)-Er3a-like [Photinus pyralis]KAB0794236.1 hypothetical protein PPYR_13856 [Photinus pyralis]